MRGRSIGLLGPNGAGKSTLINTLLGFYKSSAGSARVFGYDVATEIRKIRGVVGYMPENDAFISKMSAVSFVQMMGELSGLPPSMALERAHEALFYVGLAEARYRKLGTYSLGMKQLAKLAQAIVHGPKVLILDEPTNGLDPSARFERQLYRVNLARAELGQYSQTLSAVPVRKPVAGEVDMSSPFGMRLDPFLGRPAIHTGVDLRGDIGEPARATATGKVTIAGWDGGYGNMVEIDHGNGLATRYGHLSKILVKVGQFVRIGETVGLIGSTGRSTGPHLHYETRINGEAVDPQKFLRAGVRLGSL